jgi:2-oxoisovalerate dehydrogenase E1 component alpha subunit
MSTATDPNATTASTTASERPAPSAARHSNDTEAADVVKVLRTDGRLDRVTDPRIPHSDILRLYKAMVRVRALDARMTTLHRQGRLGFHLGSLGEEAAILGSAYAMREQDWIFPGYRELGAALLRGMPLQRYVDNMLGNANDPARGRRRPDSYGWKAGHVNPISAASGAQITQAVGFAWAARMKRDELAVLAYFGDGATSSNEFHNGLNFAGVFKAPVVLLCRNNGWATSTPTERQTGSATFAEKGIAYGIPSVRVDGNDLLAVIKVTQDAVARAARGEGATLIEAMTYRMSGLALDEDPRAPLADDGLEAWKALDPIKRVRRHIERIQPWTDAHDKAIEAELAAELEAAFAAAARTPEPSLDSMFEDVFATPPWHLVEQREALKSIPRAGDH